jgi:protein-tyrosine phosphatase
MSSSYIQPPLFSEILPGLFIGGTDDNDVIQNPMRMNVSPHLEEFQAVVTLYAFANPMSWGVLENRFGFPDSEITSTHKEVVRNLAGWLHGQWTLGKKSLSRCQAGLNRSSLVVALVLIKEGFSADEAIELIRTKRSAHALFNKSFVDFIFEEERLQKTSTFAA